MNSLILVFIGLTTAAPAWANRTLVHFHSGYARRMDIKVVQKKCLSVPYENDELVGQAAPDAVFEVDLDEHCGEAEAMIVVTSYSKPGSSEPGDFTTLLLHWDAGQEPVLTKQPRNVQLSITPEGEFLARLHVSSY